ncbi:MAG: glycosyl hydrolase 53 family protein [Bacteroidales bacterium]|nr:glycosyl hydrolase 53 family protein [Bacteroidales bacterium]
MIKRILSIAAAICCLSNTITAQHGKYVGGDISLIPQYELHNSPYLDKEGNKIEDLVVWLAKECNWNTFRVRLFVNPNGMSNDGKNVDPAVCQDLEYVKSLGKRIKDAGANFMLDIHYSDTWVDAGHIQAPEAWKNMSVDQKTAQIATYTHETLQALKTAGATPDLVQVGNEIMFGFMGIKVAPYDKTDSQWDNYLKILKAGCEAVREECPKAQIIVHTDRPKEVESARYYYGKLETAGIDYDVIGLSYYPFWHGNLTDLKKGLDGLKKDFPNKKVQIVETGYYFQYWPTTGINYNTQNIWPASPDGQYNFIKDLIKSLADYEQVEGLLYWFPEDAGNGDDTNWDTSKGTVLAGWTNRGFWWPSQSNEGHWPVCNNQKESALELFKNFLNPNITALESLKSTDNSQEHVYYNILGQRVHQLQRGQIYFVQGKKIIYQ